MNSSIGLERIRNVIFIHGSFRIVDSVVGESKIRTRFSQNQLGNVVQDMVAGTYLSVGLSISKQDLP